MIRVLVTVCLFASVAVSQTFVVDNGNGAGTNFTSLQTAVDLVPDGSVLLIRPGPFPYRPVTITAKGLSLLATGPGVSIDGVVPPPPLYSSIAVSNLAAAQSVTIRGLSIAQARATGMTLENCAGPVLIEDFTYDQPSLQGGTQFLGLDIRTCTQVTVRNSRLVCLLAMYAQSSNVTVENSDLSGHTFWVPTDASGIRADHSNLMLSRCRVHGGNGVPSVPNLQPEILPSPAIRGIVAQIRICDDGNGSYTAGASSGTTPVAAIEGTGTVVRDPSPLFAGGNGGGAVAATLLDIVRPLPSLHTVSAPPGGTVQVDVTTPVGELVLVALAQPGPVTTVPGIDGDLWLDPATAALMTLGIPQPGVPVRYSIGVPPRPELIGARYRWQALAYSATDGLRASNPSTYSH